MRTAEAVKELLWQRPREAHIVDVCQRLAQQTVYTSEALWHSVADKLASAEKSRMRIQHTHRTTQCFSVSRCWLAAATPPRAVPTPSLPERMLLVRVLAPLHPGWRGLGQAHRSRPPGHAGSTHLRVRHSEQGTVGQQHEQGQAGRHAGGSSREEGSDSLCLMLVVLCCCSFARLWIFLLAFLAGSSMLRS